MAHIISPADPQALIPPLLACLPTAFASSKPPPAFLPLLSPILRQRLQIHTSTGSSHDSWIRLLSWDSSKAETIKETIENANFEPHPSSGELEVGEIERLSYKRFDAETLKAQIPLNDWDLTALYMWCTGGEDGDAWKLAELVPYDSDLSRDQSWSSSPAEANEKSNFQASNLAVQQAASRKLSVPGQEEDDDYWAQYDQTPGRTPAGSRKPSVNPQGSSSEADYYARYGDVQPAMDSYDPDEHNEVAEESTLNGDGIQQLLKGNLHSEDAKEQPKALYETNKLHTLEEEDEDSRTVEISQPAPASPSSRTGSDMIARLEETADRYSASEIAIKQHISYTVKSMYRLAKGAGISKQEFEDLMQRELETLSLLDRED